MLAARLALAGMPDPDLLIRTGGEMRISNFLLWNLAYAELYFTEVLWPEFSAADLDAALAFFQRRERRFGRTSEQLAAQAARTSMLRLRILTALILGCVLLSGLFMLDPRWTILAFGFVWLIGAWEWAGFGGLHSLPLRLLYCFAIALLSALAWRWTEAPARCLMLLALACAWWAAAFVWLMVAPEWHRPRLACGAACRC